MNFKENILPVLLLVLAVAFIASALTAFYVMGFSADCRDAGGTFSIDGAVANCRY